MPLMEITQNKPHHVFCSLEKGVKYIANFVNSSHSLCCCCLYIDRIYYPVCIQHKMTHCGLFSAFTWSNILSTMQTAFHGFCRDDICVSIVQATHSTFLNFEITQLCKSIFIFIF